MAAIVDDLSRHPQHVEFVAGLVWREFWADAKDGMTRAELADAFGGRAAPGRVLASLIALEGPDDATPLGCVHLIDNDDDSLPELYPWLAAMVVVPERRGQGIGSMLVKAMARQAAGLGFEQLWFGTDGPGFYERLGAVKHLQRGAGFWIMKLPLTASE
ncbi:MAG TPA: GNAT family N-acetyltransferase [Piscinibacter sp.]|jgi:GNAT superfamily N-acetyltransferase|uniref:GNAT family N-acetyltransferase n=1 Tax=Piscinibacter sp. TaxID=1903157 RepID=UPI001B7CAC17|nr:GNAT family N-acetyltransferase [Piscinibacter sp.]MBK7533375.1 GNAT family N-acetyltransferase [Piscinibacter sp.]MBL0092471.1 GNAT family N-acetyltransferase [Piscinibacter sp.]MBP6541435.1 GNAT family N-acetyltransferase [Piscinibacter sp.]HNW62213.1 GNAT family N-acetyltransferase [Piscinibacter sp.]HOY37027.1 GNAT family N-acetyltransferase [Piscinibacter sp.]